MPTLGATRQTEITPVRPDWRHVPVQEGFDFPEIIRDVEKIRGNLAGRALYLVVFRSKRSPNANPEDIANADDAAYEEASVSPELASYFRGEADDDGCALSMCLWTSARAAFDAFHGPDHQKAVSRVDEFYEGNYSIEFYSVIPSDEGLLFIEHKHPQKSKDKEE
jgi:hypothetical protein